MGRASSPGEPWGASVILATRHEGRDARRQRLVETVTQMGETERYCRTGVQSPTEEETVEGFWTGEQTGAPGPMGAPTAGAAETPERQRCPGRGS
jgi:hypothetical protein